MTDKQTIANEIAHRVSTAKKADYSLWTIGLTHGPTTRKAQHNTDNENTSQWV